ncbi:MAG: saccharopine dehydrogenase NADP-binding domain-containing protein [Deinococcota bacterium]
MTYTSPKSQYDNYLVEQLVLIGVSHRRGGAAALEAWRAHFEAMLTQDMPAKVAPTEVNQPVEVGVGVPTFPNNEALLASTAVLSQMVTSHTPRLCTPQLNTHQPHDLQFVIQPWHALGFVECLPIITCNRFDVLAVLPENMSVETAKMRLTPPGQTVKPYAYRGDGALEQLIRITASLDSLNPGEDQITAQIKEAYQAAQARGSIGNILSFAVHTALRVAKRVRREVLLAPLNTSLFSLAMPLIARELPTAGRVVVLGAGEMGTLAAKTLASQRDIQLTLVNRTLASADVLADTICKYAVAKAHPIQVETMSLEAFLATPQDADALVSATPVPGIVDDALVNAMPNLRVLVDLGIPRNLTHEVTRWASQQGRTVLDVDTLQQAGQARRAKLLARLAEAEAIVISEVDAAVDAWAERQLSPSIVRLRQTYMDTIGELLPEDKASDLAHKFAHIPIKGLRAVARVHGLDVAKTFLDEVDLL